MSKKVSLEELIEGRKKAFQNACDIVQDAEILYEHQRFPRCAFLSRIAIEEFGKYLMIIGVIGQVLENQVDWKQFWKRFKNHKQKSGNILAFDVILGQFISSDDTLSKLQKTVQDAKDIEGRKLATLYVDFDSDKFNLPIDIADKAHAFRILASARAVLKFFEHWESLAFSKMTADNIGLETFLKAKSTIAEQNQEHK